MTETSLAFQNALRSRLIASAPLTTLVPASNVLDASRPEAMPCILIGTAQLIPADRYDSFFDLVASDVHVWSNEGLTAVKAIAHVIRGIVEFGQWNIEGHRAISIRLTNTRYLRDPDGVHSHGVLNIEATLQQDETL